MKKLMSWMICLMLLFSAAQGAWAAEGKYPTEWDLTLLYADVNAWEADFDAAQALCAQLPGLAGTLGTPQGFLTLFEARESLALLIDPLYGYARLLFALDRNDATAQNLLGRIQALRAEIEKALDFVSIEIIEITPQEKEAIFADERMAPYLYALDRYWDASRHVLTQEGEAALSALTAALQDAGARRAALMLEVPQVEATLQSGRKVTLGDMEYSQLIYADNLRADKVSAARAYGARFVPVQDSYAQALQDYVSANWEIARRRGYDSVMAMYLDAYGMDTAVFDLLIARTRESAALYDRFLSLKARRLGADSLYAFELRSTTAAFTPQAADYDTIVDVVREILSVFGGTYIEAYDRLATAGRIDVYPLPTKDTGAYTLGTGGEAESYVLLNFYGIPGETNRLAHEAGQALYEGFTRENTSPLYWTCTLLAQEVSSVVNELLYSLYKIENAASDDERLYYVEECLNMIGSAFFTQAMYAEYEAFIYDTVGAGQALTAQLLGEKWTELNGHYRGTAARFEGSETLWCEVPHFYRNYNVYQYAVSLACAAAVVNGLERGDQDAAARYLDFLGAGASDSPMALLQRAGADPLDGATYDSAISLFEDLVDLYESLMTPQA